MHNRCWYLLSQKLSGHATDPELSELDDLLLQHPEWHYAVQHVSSVWASNNLEAANEQDFFSHIRRMENTGVDTTIFQEPEGIEFPLESVSSKRRWATIG